MFLAHNFQTIYQNVNQCERLSSRCLIGDCSVPFSFDWESCDRQVETTFYEFINKKWGKVSGKCEVNYITNVLKRHIKKT